MYYIHLYTYMYLCIIYIYIYIYIYIHKIKNSLNKKECSVLKFVCKICK